MFLCFSGTKRAADLTTSTNTSSFSQQPGPHGHVQLESGQRELRAGHVAAAIWISSSHRKHGPFDGSRIHQWLPLKEPSALSFLGGARHTLLVLAKEPLSELRSEERQSFQLLGFLFLFAKPPPCVCVWPGEKATNSHACTSLHQGCGLLQQSCLFCFLSLSREGDDLMIDIC